MDLKQQIAEANEEVARWLTTGSPVLVDLGRRARSFCGTDADPQNLSRQSETLIEADMHVFWGNARATDFCRERLRSE